MSVLLRPIDPHDKTTLARFHSRLSEETRYRRYHGAKGSLSTRELVYFTEIDQHDHIAVVAVRADGEFAAVSRIVANGDGTAEIAVVVADDCRGKGYGLDVVEASLRAYRRERPGEPILAHVQTDNRKALRLFVDRLGGRLDRYEDGVAIIRLPDDAV